MKIQPMATRWGARFHVSAGLALGLALCAGEAWAQGPAAAGESPRETLDAGKEADRRAEFLGDPDNEKRIDGCFDADANAKAHLNTALQEWRTAGAAVRAVSTPAAEPAVLVARRTLDDAQGKRQEAERALGAAERRLEEAAKRKQQAEQAVQQAQRAQPALLPQAAADLGRASADLDTASKAVEAARTELAGAKAAEEVAKTAHDAALEKARAAATERAVALEKARREVRTALDQLTRRTPGGFEEFLKKPERVKACAGLRDDFVVYVAGPEASAAKSARDKRDEQDVREAGAEARSEDLLRKASPLTSALGSGNGFLEPGGAPDRAIFTVMGALGAEQKTNGTQVVMTLGLASVFGWSDDERSKKHAALRNLFLRAALPLSVTEPAPIAGSDGATTGEVSRMSFVLGTSLYDETDPRLFGTNRDCYKLAIAYLWNGTTLAEEAARESERREHFDVCNRRAANRHRLALRAGVGLLTQEGKTKVETFGAAFVWAPSSWLYFNGLYQRLFRPEPRHSFGGGFSFGANIGGERESGVDAWARLGMDLLVLGVRDDATGKTETEVRLQATAKVRLSNNVLSLGIGPRVVGNELSTPGVLASVALSYDADALLDPLLQPAPAPASK